MDQVAEPAPSGLREYGIILWRRKWIVVITFVVCVVGMLGYCAVAGKKYTATATVLLEPSISPLLSQASSPSSVAALVNVGDVMQVIESGTVADLVQQKIHDAPKVSVTQVGNVTTSDIVSVAASSKDPQLAANAANAYANAYIAYQKGIAAATFKSAQRQVQQKVYTVQLAITNLTNQIKASPAGVSDVLDEQQLGDLELQLTNLQSELQTYQFYGSEGSTTEVGRVISSATVPSSPSSPKTTEYVIFAAIFGLVLGIGLALLVDAVASKRT
jgi:uncharacterized protein involved in exopolysaccharide biosynthesis